MTLPVSKNHYKEGARKTPFYDRQKEWDRVNKWHRWADYTVPDYLESVSKEYFSIRNSASLFDLTPMAKYSIKGPDALDFLNRMMVRDMTKIKTGRVAYSVWCDDQGQVIDDGTIFRFAEDHYLLCAQERQLEVLKRNAIGFDVTFQEETDAIAALAFQGPVTCRILKNMGLADIETLKPFDLRFFDFGGEQLMISRTGYTGELGYEMMITPQKALALWDAIMTAGKDYTVRPIGTDALEIARVEAGFLMAGVDFACAHETIRPGHTRSPYELDLGWLVNLDKEAVFNGRRALMREKKEGSRYRFVKLDVEGNKTACNAYLFDKLDGKTIGAVSSTTWGPSAKKNIAFGYVDMPYGKAGDTIWAEIFYQKELKWNRVWAKCEVVDKPFWDPARRRQTPPADW
ncbi:aminomethyltransferase family protein [Temperatibacter marinus]|uniref:Aminomethyltransferase family protein n=1 Tax=Temperatibacter marinus TaxID=1456591 RepID=A0AA52H9I1_9PROT|nr:aminomethyltransferase family protein [Temperatibacter marinus]WND02934.1 aminomethyltransferase family protein [Temperatibacter marinus]